MTEVELGDDLIKQVELLAGAPPEDTTNSSVKFDAKGTLHVMYRNDDDKLLGDVPIKEVSYPRRHKDELYEEYQDNHDFVKEEIRKTNFALIAIGIGLLITTVLCIFIIWGMNHVI